METAVGLLRVSCLVALAWAGAACGAGETGGGRDAAARDGEGVADGGAADAGAGADAATDAGEADAGPPAAPFTAPANTWTWVDVDGTRCANGSPTGVGVNLAPDSQDVLLFLQGGGACWDGATCWGPVSTSFYVATGYGRVEFATDVQGAVMLPLQRGNPGNPFRHMNMVYVPYCTGDVHAGDHEVDYQYLGATHHTYHHGWRNVGLVLERLAATFPSLHRLWVAGDSAGGFGAALNFDRVQQRFPSVRVDVLDDSGQPIAPDATRWMQWRAAWNLQVPADCPQCADDVGAFADYYRGKYPNNRFGLISYTNDAVITTFMGLAPTTFSDELQALAAHMDAAWPDGRYFFIPGILHVGLATPTPALEDWLTKMITDDPAWASQH